MEVWRIEIVVNRAVRCHTEVVTSDTRQMFVKGWRGPIGWSAKVGIRGFVVDCTFHGPKTDGQDSMHVLDT